MILIADGDDWRHLENMGAYDRFQVSLDLAHPLRFDHAPLVGAAVKPFTNIKFEVDESQPETPVLRMVPQ